MRRWNGAQEILPHVQEAGASCLLIRCGGCGCLDLCGMKGSVTTAGKCQHNRCHGG